MPSICAFFMFWPFNLSLTYKPTFFNQVCGWVDLYPDNGKYCYFPYPYGV